MTYAKKITFVVFGFLAIGLVWYFYSWRQEDFMPAKENAVIINLESTDNTVYLRTKVWGISGNHEEIVLSESNNPISNKTVDYIFYTSDVYYKAEGNTITIYAPESSISEPIKKFSSVTVKVKGLKSIEEMKDYETNFKKYGLVKISIYDDHKSQ